MVLCNSKQRAGILSGFPYATALLCVCIFAAEAILCVLKLDKSAKFCRIWLKFVQFTHIIFKNVGKVLQFACWILTNLEKLLNITQISKCKNIWSKRAHGPYTLVGPPVSGLVLDPLVAFTSTTVYIWVKKFHFEIWGKFDWNYPSNSKKKLQTKRIIALADENANIWYSYHKVHVSGVDFINWFTPCAKLFAL